MKLILKFGLGALLVAILAVPALAGKYQSGAKQSEVKQSHEPAGVKGESTQEMRRRSDQNLAPAGVKGESTQEKRILYDPPFKTGEPQGLRR